MEDISQLELNQVVHLKFRRNGETLTGTIRGVHLYKEKIKYDLELWLDVVDHMETYTRIYNVDSTYVSPR